MESREAPLDDIVVRNNYNNYMATVNVSPKKYVCNRQWSSYSQVEQEIHLLKQYKHVLSNYKLFNNVHRFEVTKQGHKHLHFVCSTSEAEMERVQAYFHGKFGMPCLNPSICCHYTKTEVCRTHAEAYVTKEDDEVPSCCLFLRKDKH